MTVSNEVHIMTGHEFKTAEAKAFKRGVESGKRAAVTPQTITLADAWDFYSQALGGEPSAEKWLKHTRETLERR